MLGRATLHRARDNTEIWGSPPYALLWWRDKSVGFIGNCYTTVWKRVYTQFKRTSSLCKGLWRCTCVSGAEVVKRTLSLIQIKVFRQPSFSLVVFFLVPNMGSHIFRLHTPLRGVCWHLLVVCPKMDNVFHLIVCGGCISVCWLTLTTDFCTGLENKWLFVCVYVDTCRRGVWGTQKILV